MIQEVVMLRGIDDLIGYKLLAKDGDIGKVYDFYFDDYMWAIRYMVADTGNWLPGRRVLISTYSLEEPDSGEKVFPVSLLKSQIENSPGVDSHIPMERQKEIELTQYYGWPEYWTGLGAPAGAGVFPAAGFPSEIPVRPEKEEENRETHLHSARAIIGLNIEGTDDNIGHVEDFIIDNNTWDIRYVIVDTRNWFPGGKKVILSPHWIKKMDWLDSKVYIDLTIEQIKSSPEWNPEVPPQRDYEEKLYGHYDRDIYW
jgi:hypothetical protein